MNLGYYHPLVIHFAIALLAVGVAFRLVSLSGRLEFTRPAAAALLLIGTLATVLAAKTGRDAHAPVEHMPGTREALNAHQEWGLRARNVFLGVAALEILALALARRSKTERLARLALIASGVIGVAGSVALYRAGKDGGRLVYAYAGGVGVRSGDPADLDRLLLAGLFHKAMNERAAGRRDEAAALFAELGQRFGAADPDVALYSAESLILDRRDPTAAVDALARITIPADDLQHTMRRGWLTADALEALGRDEEAMRTLRALDAAHPGIDPLKKRIERGFKAPPLPPK